MKSPAGKRVAGILAVAAACAALGVAAIEAATGSRMFLLSAPPSARAAPGPVGPFPPPAPDYSRVEDGLYIGAHVAAPPPLATAVLNLCEHEDLYKADHHAWVAIPDAAPHPGLDWLRDRVAWVDGHRKDGRTVYVHCAAGRSRSALVVLAYDMWRTGRTRDDALARLRARRPIVEPNPSFLELLAAWEKAVAADRAGGVTPPDPGPDTVSPRSAPRP